MKTATITRTIETDANYAIQVLRNSDQAGDDATDQALKALGAKKGRETALDRLRACGRDFLASDRRWKIRDVDQVVSDVERQARRRLTHFERWTLENALLDAIEALV